MTKQRHILVTGAAGFIGSNFVRIALENGYCVTGLDSLSYAG
jgi:dTDP-glucose 4,6-dehydratase